ncbi:MAG: hypothetical protein CBD58_03750 [bacterium TMED198]|nr:MAG: hypothetical protein CBD58_03750 [bacterium TMED198]
MNIKKHYLFFVSLLIFLSCSTKNLANLSLVSTREIKQADLKNPIPEEYKLLGYINGEETTHIIIVFPTGPAPRLDNAIQNTLNKYGADYLTNVKISQKNLYIPYIGGYSSILVKGQGWVHENNYSIAKDAYLSSQNTKKSDLITTKKQSNKISNDGKQHLKSSSEKQAQQPPEELDSLYIKQTSKDSLKNETIKEPKPFRFDPETGKPIYK